MMSRAEILRLLESKGFRLFLQVEDPKLEVYIPGPMLDDPDVQPVMLGTARDGHTDIWLSLGTTIDAAHEERMVRRLHAHLESL